MSSLSSHLRLLADQVNPSPGLLVSPNPAPPHHMAPVLLSTITCDKGMVQADVGQKLLKHHILRVFSGDQ
jgi:hypothetical protein